MTGHDIPSVDWEILAGYRGSHAHGTAIDPADDPEFGTDDIDTMHVVVPPPRFYLGLDQYGSRGTREIKQGPYDAVCYEARKFVSLLCKGNPTVLSLLWLPASGYGLTKITQAGAILVAQRRPFTLTRRTVTAFVGYAQAQADSMRKDPTHRAYMGERRRALAQRFGYDVKHAAHTIRLLRMVCELMEDQCLHVLRHDYQQLVAIKRGEWSLDDVLSNVDVLLARARELEAGLDWPDEVDRDWASTICMNVVRMAIG